MIRVLLLIVPVVLLGVGALAYFFGGQQGFEIPGEKRPFAEEKTAADQGDAESQYRLGRLYEDGRGVLQNYVQAHLYYNLAAARGSAAAVKSRDALADKMSKEELTQARKLAAAWKPEKKAEKKPASIAEGKPATSAPVKPDDPLALFRAADEGDAKRVKELLSGGADAALADAEGKTPLMFAAGNGHDEILTLLLKGGADPEAVAEDGATALLAATLGGHGGAITALLDAGADPNAAPKNGPAPLMVALLSKHQKAAQALIDGGADVDIKLAGGTTALMLSVASGQKELTRALLDAGVNLGLSNSDGVTPLMAAVRAGDGPLVRDLLERGADPAPGNNQGQNALDLADQRRDAKTAEILMGFMPEKLMDAVNRGYVAAVQSLIARGADFGGTTNDGWSALMFASAKGDTQMAAVLIAGGAKVDHQNKNGITALMAAALEGHAETVKLLIEAGADTGIKTGQGDTAKTLAAEKGLNDIVAALAAHKESLRKIKKVRAEKKAGERARKKSAAEKEAKEQARKARAAKKAKELTREKAAWAAADEQNTVRGFEKFISAFPKSGKRDAAYSRIERLRGTAKQETQLSLNEQMRVLQAAKNRKSEEQKAKEKKMAWEVFQKEEAYRTQREAEVKKARAKAQVQAEAERQRKIQEGMKWGAVAQSADIVGTRSFYYAWKAADASAAQAAVLADCRRNSTDGNCKIEVTFDKCFAIAFSGLGPFAGWGWSIKNDVQSARSEAESKCNEKTLLCSIGFAVCGDGSGHYGK